MKIEHVFSLERFDPQETPAVVRWFGQMVVLPLMAFWVSGAYIVFEFARGNRLLAVMLFPVWALAVSAASAALHRAGYARIGVSLGTTATVLLAAGLVCFRVV